MKKLITYLLAVYLCLSMGISVLYNLCPSIAWDIASHRHGLLVVSVDNDGIWVLNPLSCAADDWL